MKLHSPAPIALFVYRRPAHTRQTLESLALNSHAAQSTLHVFCDGAASPEENDAVAEVRRVVRERAWCGTVVIHESEENKGLATSIIRGVTQITEEHGCAIVVEDDMVLSPGFLTYMNEALELYAQDEKVMHISGHLPETTWRGAQPATFFSRFMDCWGWATWRRAWRVAEWRVEQLRDTLIREDAMRHFDLDGVAGLEQQLNDNIAGNICTWGVRWAATIYINGGLCLCPGASLVRNTGVDGSGTNCIVDCRQEHAVSLVPHVRLARIPLRESRRGRAYLQRFYRYGRDSSRRRIWKLRVGIAKHRLMTRLGWA